MHRFDVICKECWDMDQLAIADHKEKSRNAEDGGGAAGASEAMPKKVGTHSRPSSDAVRSPSQIAFLSMLQAKAKVRAITFTRAVSFDDDEQPIYMRTIPKSGQLQSYTWIEIPPGMDADRSLDKTDQVARSCAVCRQTRV